MQKLKEKYSPEGSLLREHQKRILEIVKVLDDICQKHSIPYWIEGGTLLGAVRHKGFIPWDDDLDIQMLRKDLKKLIKLLPSELPPNLALQTHNTDKFYLRHLVRIRDLNSHLFVSNTGDWNDYKYQGIFIDIFAIDSSLYRIKYIRNLCYYLYWKRIMLWGKISNKYIKIKYPLFLLWFKIEQLFSIFNVLVGKILNSKELNYCQYGIDLNGIKLMPNDIFPLQRIKFENIHLNAPQNIDKILSQYYGDYMKLPPEDKRKQNHSINLTLKKI